MSFLKKPTDPDEIAKYRDLLASYPARMIKTEYPDLGVVIYENKPGDKPLAQAYSGKRCNYDFFHSFHSEERKRQYLADYITGTRCSAIEKQTRQQDKRAFKTSLKVGDILHGSWGYDQTNAEFLQIIALKGDRATVRHIAKRQAGNSSMVVGIPNAFRENDPAQTKIIQIGDCISYDVYTATKWDGFAVYETNAYSGH